jgi:hypothetical protein
MDIQNEHAETIINLASKASYSISGGLVVLDVLDFMNEYAAAMGVILGFITLLINLIFQILNHHTIKKAIQSDK